MMISAASWVLKQNRRDISFLKAARLFGFSTDMISPKKQEALEKARKASGVYGI